MDSEAQLVFGERTIARIARSNGRGLIESVWIQAWAELSMKILKNINFRSSKNKKACEAYSQMDGGQFTAINARQNWSNWRTVPRNMSGQIQNQPLFAIDLCSGVGDSTKVLAHYLPAGSKILGIEIVPGFVEIAKKRRFVDCQGSRVNVDFSARSVLEEFRSSDCVRIPGESVDIVNCCGALGFHFCFEESEKLITEINRVVKPGGLAMLDTGISGISLDALINLMKKYDFEFVKFSKSCWVDLHGQACFRKRKVQNGYGFPEALISQKMR